MKHAKSHPRRDALPVGLCLLALIPLALAPALFLHLADRYTLGRVQAVAEPFAPRPQSLEDFYLLRQLALRGGAAITDSTDSTMNSGIYAPAAVLRGDMTYDAAMGTYALDLMQRMVDAGALPESWLAALGGAVGQRENGYYNGNFYYSSDSLGFVRIHAYNGSRGSHLLMAMTVESHTGRVVRLWLGLPADTGAAAPADTGAVLQAFVAFNGLDTLGDWAPPEGSAYAENGLYSAAGQVLATCACYDFTYNGPAFTVENDPDYHYAPDEPVSEMPEGPVFEKSDWPYIALSLTLDWSAGVPMPLESGPQREGLPYAIGELTPLGAAGSDGEGKRAGNGNALYEIAECDDEYAGLITCTDYGTMQREIYCSVLGCRHSTPACPAWLPYLWLPRYGLFWADGQLWLLRDTGLDEAERAEAQQALLDAVGAENEAQLDEALARTPALLADATVHYLYAQAQPNALDLVGPAGRTTVQALPAGVDWLWHDEQALFGLRLDNSAGTAALVRVPFAGEVTETPLLNPELLLRARQITACGNRLLLTLPLAPVPDPDTQSETALLSLGQMWHTALVRYDPATGASELLYKSEPGTALGIAGAWPGQVVLAAVRQKGEYYSDISRPYDGTLDVESLLPCRLPQSGPLQPGESLPLATLSGFAPETIITRFVSLPGGDGLYIHFHSIEADGPPAAHYLFWGTGQATTIDTGDPAGEGLLFLDRLPDGRYLVQSAGSTPGRVLRGFLSPVTGRLESGWVAFETPVAG